MDSCETITVKADAKSFASSYQLEGSQTSNDIQQLRKSVSDIQRKVNSITPEMSAAERNAKIAEITADIEKHKVMARQLILQNPRSAAAYFAIYQKVNNSYIFSPYVKEDKPYCAAVATSYNTFMPEYVRSKNLYGLVMDAIQTERKEKERRREMKNIKFMLLATVILIAAADMENSSFFMIKSIICFLILLAVAVKLAKEEK